MLDIKDLSKAFNEKPIVNNVSISIAKGEIVGLLGPNGAGKTTIFYMLAGLLKPDTGSITIDHEDITLAPMHQRANKGLVYLPQEASIFQSLSVWENIYGAAELLHSDLQTMQEKTNEVVYAFNLDGILNQKGRTLSGGQRRRVEIARCMLFDPRIILLDEPFAGVDPLVVDEINLILKQLQSKNISVLITDHNVNQTLKICDRSYIISEGKVIASGTGKELVDNKLVVEKYFGNLFA